MRTNNIENPLYHYKKLIFIFIIIFLTVIVGIANINDIRTALDEVIHINVFSIITLLVLLIIHLILDGLVLYIAIDDINLGKKKAFLINMAGYFFSNITPMYIGSYPSRLYYLYKDNIPVSKSLSAFTVRAISYQIVLNLIAIISFFLVKDQIQSLGGYAILFYFGLIFNIFTGTFLFLISVSKKINSLVMNIIKKLAKKLSFIKKREAEVLESVDNYYHNARRVYTDFKYSFKIFILVTIKTLIMYIIPVIVFIGLGLDVKSIILEIIAFSSLIAIIASVFPSPGGMASSEAVFILLFSLIIVSSTTVNAAMLVWRIFSFYFVVVIGLICTLILQTRKSKRNIEITNNLE